MTLLLWAGAAPGRPVAGVGLDFPLATTFPTFSPRGSFPLPPDETVRLRAFVSPAWLFLPPVLLGAALVPALFWRRRWAYLSAVSALLCLLAAALWIRSYRVYDQLQITRHLYTDVASSAGQVYLTWSDDGPRETETLWVNWERTPQHGRALVPSGRIVDAGWQHLWFGAGTDPSWYGVPTTFRRVVVPYGALVVAAALLPVSWGTTAMRRRRRISQGRCAACGYDLRATPAGPAAGGTLRDRCPECGAVPSPAVASPKGPA